MEKALGRKKVEGRKVSSPKMKRRGSLVGEAS